MPQNLNLLHPFKPCSFFSSRMYDFVYDLQNHIVQKVRDKMCSNIYKRYIRGLLVKSSTIKHK